MGDHLEAEKRNRADVDKAKRKMESDLKLCQENVEELDRIRQDLEENQKRSVCYLIYLFNDTKHPVIQRYLWHELTMIIKCSIILFYIISERTA